MSDESAGRPVEARLRAVVESLTEQLDAALAALAAERERGRLRDLRIAELERRLNADSSDSGTPTSKEGIGAKAARKARERQESERERSKDRKRGGQPGHKGEGPQRDPGPGETKTEEPPAWCRACKESLAGAAPAGEARWAQSVDVKIVRQVTEFLLPGLACPCCGEVTYAQAPPGLHPGAVSCGPVLNAAAVLLTAYGNVPAERSAQLIGMLLGTQVSPGWAGKAVARVSARLQDAGFDEAMMAALAAEDVLAADETPVNVLDKTPPPASVLEPAAQEAGEAGEADPEDKDGKKEQAGAPHVLIIGTPDARLRLLLALSSRRKESVASGVPAGFAGYLMTDGYTGYQHLLSRIKGIGQCGQHVIRRARQVMKLGPGSLQDWAHDVIKILGEALGEVEEARARGSTALDQQVLEGLRERYDAAVRFGLIHNRLRDWDGGGNHPGYALAAWLRDYKEQVFLFTRHFGVAFTNNISERGAKAAKRHQAVSGYWHSLATLARWCRIRSYLDSAATHGITALDAVAAAIAETPWLPPLPAVS